MRPEQVEFFRSPTTGLEMRIQAIQSEQDGDIQEGTLTDGKDTFSIRNFIPRFVPETTYSDSFGAQWNRYRSVQIDSENKLNLTAERFYRWTGWKKEELKGKRILEAGCGAGRFTEVMIAAGAEVYSLDMSSAIDACWRTNGPNKNLCLAQADIYHLPFKLDFFDRVFCYGVLQHTPDPKRAFLSLVPSLRRGGRIAIDCYAKSKSMNRWTSKYIWRGVTTRLAPETLFKLVEWYVPKWLPIDTVLSGIPRIGRKLVGIIPCWNYTGMLDLSASEIVQWAILDTFDALSPKYDQPQTLDEVCSWFQQSGLADIEVKPGSNGIVGNASKALSI